MPITSRVNHQFACPSCGLDQTDAIWAAIDLVERPELQATVASTATYVHACKRCPRVIPRTVALAVTRLSPAAPVLVGLGLNAIQRPNPLDTCQPLVDELAEQARLTPAPIAWPVVPVPFPVLAEAAQRDVEADMATPDQAVAEVSEKLVSLGALYRLLLHELEATQPERDVHMALARLHRTINRQQLEELIEDFPVLLDPALAAMLADDVQATTVVEQRRMLEAEVRLLDACRASDIDAAWSAYEPTIRTLWHIEAIPTIQALVADFRVVADGDPPTGIAIGEEMFARASHIGWHEQAAAAAWWTALCLLRLRDRRHPERIERAIELLEQAEELYDRHDDIGDASDRRHVQANLAAALGERTRSDHAADQRRAIAIHRRLLEDVSVDEDPELWAKTHTHLAASMLQLALATDDVDDDGRVNALDDILGHLDLALTRRRRDLDPLDWAFTELHLGRAHAEGGGSLTDAVEHYAHAADGFMAAEHPALAARAGAGQASVRLRLAGQTTDPTRRRRLATEAEQHARESLDVLQRGPGTVLDGTAWWQLARAMQLRGADRGDVRNALAHVLEFWTAQTAPAQATRAARWLGMLCDEDDDRRSAADAWATAAAAAAADMQLPGTRDGRLAKAREHAGVFVDAAFRLCTTGRAAEAVEVLELGRARELAAWLDQDLVDLRELRHVEPQLHERFVELSGDVAAMQSGRPEDVDVRVAAAAERLQRLIADIRAVPGLEAFMRRPDVTALLGQAATGQLIAYPLLCVAGCAWLVVQPGASQPIVVLDVPMGVQDIADALVRVDADTGEASGYLPAHRDTDLLDDAIRVASAILGPGLMRVLHEHATSEGVDDVCLVPVGWLGVVALHALSWPDDDRARCLIDGAVVSYAPSIYARVVCEQRAARRDRLAATLLAVGNPLPSRDPLRYAEVEATQIADIVGADSPTVLLGPDAHKGTVVAALPQVTHVHLACHGSAAVTPDPLQSALWFADDEGLSAAELVDLPLEARLVVASACESALIAEQRAVDEALALSNVLVAAGAAGVVASLWEVHDYATALLMTRLYELVGSGMHPAGALRGASVWLRDLTVADELAFLAAHPTLDAACDADTRNRLHSSPGHERHLTLPTLWAAFTFTGA